MMTYDELDIDFGHVARRSVISMRAPDFRMVLIGRRALRQSAQMKRRWKPQNIPNHSLHHPLKLIRYRCVFAINEEWQNWAYS